MADETLLTPASASALLDAIAADPTKYVNANTSSYAEEYASSMTFGTSAAGKKKFIVDSSNIDLVFAKSKIKDLTRKPNIADAVRGQGGNFWSYTGAETSTDTRQLMYFSQDTTRTVGTPFKMHFNTLQELPVQKPEKSTKH